MSCTRQVCAVGPSPALVSQAKHMTKKQVIALSSLLCVVGLALGIVLVMSAFSNAGNYSLVAWVVFTVLGVSCLGLVASPGLLLAWYPAEGFSGGGAPAAEPDVDHDDLDDHDIDDDDADGMVEEDTYEDDGEQLFDDDVIDDEFDDEFGEFEDDDRN
jgi:hypothetical protein